MKILVLGGDGFCGWPTVLHLSALGHEVAVVDNLSRRKIDIELECESLTPIKSLGDRLRAWAALSGQHVAFHSFDVAKNYQRLLDLLNEWRPHAVVHFAEQRAAPYSMKSSLAQALHGRQQPQRHQQSPGCHRRSGSRHPCRPFGHDGRLWLWHRRHENSRRLSEGEGRDRAGPTIESEILYPANPGSIYHMTKTQDQLLFFYYNKNDGVRITDLHQGIVWGTQTEQTRLDERLINRFDYDGDYGTVLNRFLMQAAVGHPLTVHGTGGQTRAFIHIQDTVRCIQLAMENPPEPGDRVNILNQMTETHRVRDLAKMVSD